MKTLSFAIHIQASRQTVWDAVIGPDTYRIWTAEFAEGSTFEGSWAQGERIRFLGPNGDGMSSIIAENRPYERLSIKHLGCIKGGVEDTDSEEARAWVSAFETYDLAEAGTGTDFQVHMDVTEEYEAYMTQVWPKALAKLKALCEAPSPGPV